MRTVLVDGDNTLWALKKRAHPLAEQFLQQLELAAVEKDWEVVVVFDGPERHTRRESGPLVVQYAVGRTADSVIERLAHDTRDKSGLIVVTQDRAQADLVRGFGARVWSAERLQEEMGYNDSDEK